MNLSLKNKNIFFTSDIFLGRDSILEKHSNFEDIEDYNSFIISNWNRVVGKKDIVIVL